MEKKIETIKRILIKTSGEMLGGSFDEDSINFMAKSLKAAYETGADIGVVIGAGNIMRGAGAHYIQRSKADSAGMLGTVINSIVLQDTLENKFDIPSIVLGAFEIDGICRKNSPSLIKESFEQKKIIIFGGGTGAPYFSTDTAGVLKALEMGAELMVKATKVDGVYDKDPKKFSDAKKYAEISYMDTLEQKLGVMDLTAASLAMENHLPIRVVDLKGENLAGIIKGQNLGTLIS